LDNADGYSELDTTDFLGFDETRLKKSHNGMLCWHGILQWTAELRQVENTQFAGTGQSTKFSATSRQDHGFIYGILEEGD
jgi:hypothetical protein